MKPLASFFCVLGVSLSADITVQQSPIDHMIDRSTAVLETKESAPIALQGRVLKEDGLPAAGAVVISSAGGQAVTKSDGTFQLEVNLPHGAQSVQVTAVANGNHPDQVGTRQVSGLIPGRTTQVDMLHLAKSSGCQPSWLPAFGTEPGANNEVSVLTVFDDGSGAGPALYVGGRFTSAGGIPAVGIARWDGTSWSTLGTGLSAPGFGGDDVSALAIFDDGSGGGPALYAAGYFTNAGGVAANSIAKWDGSSWSPLGTGMTGINPSVSALAVFDDNSGGGPALFAGGFFDNAGGVAANGLAKWDGSSWSAVGTGLGVVTALTVFDDSSGPALFVGGKFMNAGGVPAKNIAKWNGSTWYVVGSGLDDFVFALTVFDDQSGGGPALYAAGRFSFAGTVFVNNIAKWDGTSWSPLGSGINAISVGALAVFDDGSGGGPALYAGGAFTSAGAVPAPYIAKWDGTIWSALSNGMNNHVGALAVFDDGSGGGPVLYAGGFFTRAGTASANGIARWDGASWFPLEGGAIGLNNAVRALAVFDEGSGAGPALYAGGFFTSASGVPANSIAKWDRTGWSPLGSGMSGYVTALTVFDDQSGGGPALYAGGFFSSAGGVSAGSVAKWDGTSWSSLGSVGSFALVFALEVFDDGGGPALYVAGSFNNIEGFPARNIAKWDGSSWSALVNGLNGRVEALEVFDDQSGAGPALYAGGFFTVAGGIPAHRMAKWDGSSWSALGSGIDGIVVLAMTVFDDGSGPALYAGGDFTVAGGVSANRIAKWNGTSWSPLGNGRRGMGNPVYSLGVFDDLKGGGPALYAGGEFTVAGGSAANRIAKWNGTRWSPLGSGVAGSGPGQGVSALTEYDDGSGSGPALVAAGSFTVTSSGDSFIARWGCPAPPPFTTFCTAKTELICGPANISATGSPSASATSGFTIKAQPVRGCRAGLLLYSNQPTVTGVPFGGPGDGVLCLFAMGLRRAGPIQTGSIPSLCESTLAIDMNRFRSFNWAAAGCNPPPGQNTPAGFLSNPGTTVNAQMWGRDSIATGQVLSDGISWVVGP